MGLLFDTDDADLRATFDMFCGWCRNKWQAITQPDTKAIQCPRCGVFNPVEATCSSQLD